MYAQFDLLTPSDADEVLGALAASKGENGAVLLGGGTNLIVDIRARGSAPDTLVSIAQIPGLRGISITEDRVTVGGATTVSEILRHPDMAQAAPALVDAARVFAGQMVRNTATIAGNICYGSPAADLVPPLLALDAEVTLESKRGSRTVPLSEYFTGYKTSVREPDELMTAVSWPLPSNTSASGFYKLARRKGDAITVLGVAVSLSLENGQCAKARIALGCVGPCVIRANDAEAILEGSEPTPELIEAAAAKAMEDANPIDDVRASAEYRKQQVQVLVRRLLGQAHRALTSGDQQP